MVRGALHLMTAIGYNHRYVSRGRAFDRLMKQALTAARQLLQELERINAPRPDASAQRCCGRWGYPLGKRPSTYAMGAGLRPRFPSSIQPEAVEEVVPTYVGRSRTLYQSGDT